MPQEDAVGRELGREPTRDAVRRLDEHQLAVRVAHRDARVALLGAQLQQQPHGKPFVVDALSEAHSALSESLIAFEHHNAAELLAEDLKRVQTAIDSLTGRIASDDILGLIFSSFCIGK